MKSLLKSTGVLLITMLLLFLTSISAGWCADSTASTASTGSAAVPASAPGAGVVQPNHYDLIVVGSDPEGIAAAISGARNGLSTLLMDTRPEVGGLMTRGWLNTIDMNVDPHNQILNQGIFSEFYNQVGQGSFDVPTAETVFENMIKQEPNLHTKLSLKDMQPVFANQSKKLLQGIQAVEPDGTTTVFYGKKIIDATQDADIAAAAGVPFSWGQQDMGSSDQKMAVTLVFKLKGISDEDWQKLSQALNTDQDPNSGAYGTSAWGFGGIMSKYQPDNARVGLRGLNIGRQKDGTVLINALHVFGVEVMFPESRQTAQKIAIAEMPDLVAYLKKNIPGFENAELAGTAPELYVRESRHIYGLYRLSINDVLGNTDFWDRIAFGSYPVDIQATSPTDKGTVLGVPAQYAIPFRCIVPQGIDNLLVVGRSASFDSLASGSARTIPVGMATGQAAGAAAAISIEHNCNFPEMAANHQTIAELQDSLNKQGMDLHPFHYDAPGQDNWTYDGLEFIRQYGLAAGGYNNNYMLDNDIPTQSFTDLLKKMMNIYHLSGADKIPAKLQYTTAKQLTAQDAATILSSCQGLTEDETVTYQTLFSNDPQAAEHMKSIIDGNKTISHGMAYVMLKDFFTMLKANQK